VYGIPVNRTTIIAFLICETYGLTYNIKPRIGNNWHLKSTYQNLTLSSLRGAIAFFAPLWIRPCISLI